MMILYYLREKLEFNENDNLIYNGEYLNSKRNGKGKKYNEGRLIFEGEYLNGEKNGRGKEYYYNSNKIKFESEFKNGKKWNGKGYGYFSDEIFELINGNTQNVEEFDDDGEGNVIFEGKYLNGEKNGKVKKYD